jgi:hypothetical protein
MVVYTNHVNNINTKVTAFVMMVLSRWRRVEGSAFTMVEKPKLAESRRLVKAKKRRIARIGMETVANERTTFPDTKEIYVIQNIHVARMENSWTHDREH